MFFMLIHFFLNYVDIQKYIVISTLAIRPRY